MARMDPELLRLEHHNCGYGGSGTLSHVVFPNGTVASIPQKADELLRAVALVVVEGP